MVSSQSYNSGDQRLAVDAEGHALISGTFPDYIEPGGGLPAFHNYAAFVAWYDSEGRHVKDHVFPLNRAQGSAWGRGVGVDGEGHVLLGGWFSGTGDFGMGPVTSCANTTFLLKVDPTPPTPSHFNPIITRGDSSSDRATPGRVLTFEVEAMDLEGSALTFSWAADAGTPGTRVEGASVSRLPWTAPACERAGVSSTITLIVTNAFGLTATMAKSRSTYQGRPRPPSPPPAAWPGCPSRPRTAPSPPAAFAGTPPRAPPPAPPQPHLARAHATVRLPRAPVEPLPACGDRGLREQEAEEGRGPRRIAPFQGLQGRCDVLCYIATWAFSFRATSADPVG